MPPPVLGEGRRVSARRPFPCLSQRERYDDFGDAQNDQREPIGTGIGRRLMSRFHPQAVGQRTAIGYRRQHRLADWNLNL